MTQLAVIVASTREKRFADTIARWLLGELSENSDIEVDLIDLRELDLPVTWQGKIDGVYPSLSLRSFAERVEGADAYVVITPEYNHSYPASIKVALDALGNEWRAKPIGFVSYGGMSGGLRAVEALRPVVAELHMVSIRDGVSFHNAWRQFDPSGVPVDPVNVKRAVKTMLGQLLWWAEALQAARVERPYVA